MKQLMTKCVGALAAAALTSACATVPDDAPADFHSAKAEIEAMRDADAKTMTPVTAERAEEAFDASLDMLETAEDSEGHEAEKVAAASAKAREAKTLASTALELNRSFKAWDQNAESFSQLIRTNEAIAQLRGELGEASKMMASASRPFGRDTWTKPVAFFQTGHAHLGKASTDTVRELATLMKQHAGLKVKLVGGADERGSAKFNQELAERRAATVAETLADLGIAKERIVVASLGEKLAKGDVSRGEEMQADRRVDATLFSSEQTAAH